MKGSSRLIVSQAPQSSDLRHTMAKLSFGMLWRLHPSYIRLRARDRIRREPQDSKQSHWDTILARPVAIWFPEFEATPQGRDKCNSDYGCGSATLRPC